MTTRSTIPSRAVLSTADTAVSTSVPGEAVILDPASGRYFGLDGVGARAWELLGQRTTLDRMVATLVEEYAVDAATCERDVRVLLADLQERGLIVVGDAQP